MAASKALAPLKSGGTDLSKINPKKMAELMRKARERNASAGGGDRDYMSFSGKQNRWTIGRAKVEPSEEMLFAFEPLSLVEGLKFWKNNKVVKELSWSQYADPPFSGVDDPELPEMPEITRQQDGWKTMVGGSFISLEEPTKQIVFTTTTISAINAFSDFCEEVEAAASKAKPGEEDSHPFIPVFTVSSEEFEAHEETNWKPVFNVVAWVSRDEIRAYAADEDGTVDDLLEGAYSDAEDEAEDEPEEDAPEPKAASKGKKKAPEAEEPAPKKRTRRRKAA